MDASPPSEKRQTHDMVVYVSHLGRLGDPETSLRMTV